LIFFTITISLNLFTLSPSSMTKIPSHVLFDLLGHYRCPLCPLLHGLEGEPAMPCNGTILAESLSFSPYLNWSPHLHSIDLSWALSISLLGRPCSSYSASLSCLCLDEGGSEACQIFAKILQIHCSKPSSTPLCYHEVSGPHIPLLTVSRNPRFQHYLLYSLLLL
jgi:hypothetical protein